MRYLIAALSMLLCAAVPAQAQISVDIGFPGISIGINVPSYPRLVRVPGYPVYYDPRANSNYFFYDGLYWVYQSDNWYASSWYNGPWQQVERYDVPLYLLRVPVRYYRHPPTYFRGWRADAPPRWGEHWGGDWERRRAGWDQWDRRAVPAPAPLPAYQQQYSGNRYPRALEQQLSIRDRNYRYQPREAVTQQHYQRPAQQQDARSAPRIEPRQQAPVQQPSPSAQRQQREQAQQRQAQQQAQQQQAQQQQAQQQQAQQQQAQQQQAQQRQAQQRQAQQPPAPATQQEQRSPQGQGGLSRQPPGQAQRAPEAQPGKGAQDRGAPQGKGAENRAEPQGKGRDDKPQGKGKDKDKDSKEERDSGR